MDGNTPGIDSRHTRRCHHGDLFRRLGSKPAQEGCFARTGLTGDKQTLVGLGCKFLRTFIGGREGHTQCLLKLEGQIYEKIEDF